MSLRLPDRRGVTLVELLVATILLALLGAAALRTLAALTRQSASLVEHATVQETVRHGLLLVQAELREVGADSGTADLFRLAADSLTYRGARGLGVTCAVSPTEVRILDAPPLPYAGIRAIAPDRDSLLLFVEGDTTTARDDRWVRAPVYSAAPGTCGASAAIVVGTADLRTLLPSGNLSDMPVGGPVRTFEVMRLAEYTSGGQRWLGLASVSAGEAIQPVVGPLAGGGLTLSYLDATGAPADDPAVVRGVRATLAATSDRAIAGNWAGGAARFVADSLTTQITLRNLLR